MDCGQSCDCGEKPCECPCSDRDLTDEDLDKAVLDIAQRSVDQPFRYVRGLDADISDYVIDDADGVRVDWDKAERGWLGARRRRLELLHGAIVDAPEVVAERGWSGVDAFMVGLLMGNMAITVERAVQTLVDAHGGR